MNNSGEYENNNDYFKDNIDKQEGYKMSDCLIPYCKNVIMSIQGFDNDEQLKEHLSHVIENDNLYVFFGIVEKEFNQFLNCDLKFVFSTWYNKNHLEFRQHENQIFMSSSSYISMLCYYAFILYQSDHLNDEKIKRMCFQNILVFIISKLLYCFSYFSLEILSIFSVYIFTLTLIFLIISNSFLPA